MCGQLQRLVGELFVKTIFKAFVSNPRRFDSVLLIHYDTKSGTMSMFACIYSLPTSSRTTLPSQALFSRRDGSLSWDTLFTQIALLNSCCSKYI